MLRVDAGGASHSLSLLGGPSTGSYYPPSHSGTSLGISRGSLSLSGRYPAVVIMADGGEVLWKLQTTTKGEAQTIAEAIAKYTGAMISSA
jgi:hypothetical protein